MVSDEKLGSVVFVGDDNTVCYDAVPYRDPSQGGESPGESPGEGEDSVEAGAILNKGDVLTGIPEYMLKRFLANANFQPSDEVATSANQELEFVRAAVNNAISRGRGVVSTSQAVSQASGPRVMGREIPAPPELPEDGDLSKLNKGELIQLADYVGVTRTNDDTRADLIAKIRDSETPGTPGTDGGGS